MIDERLEGLIRKARHTSNLAYRAQERQLLAIQNFRARCMDNDPADMVLAREEVYSRTEVLLDLTAQLERERREAEDYIVTRGKLL